MNFPSFDFFTRFTNSLSVKGFIEKMGVHGLWSLLEPVGKPVPLETLENKVLAVGNYPN